MSTLIRAGSLRPSVPPETTSLAPEAGLRGPARLRDGALRWELFHDPADPPRYVETFLVESWVEHLRQHERVTLSDREAETRARALHRGPTSAAVSRRFLASR